MTDKKYGAFSSSVDPQKLAASVEGLVGFVGMLLVFFGVFDVATETTLLAHVNQLVTDVIVITPLIGTMASLCWSIFGLLRKAVVAFIQAKKVGPMIQAQTAV